MISPTQAAELATSWVASNTPDLVIQSNQPEDFEGQWLFTLGTSASPDGILLDTPALAVNQETGETDWFTGGTDPVLDDTEPQDEEELPTDG